MHFGNGAAVRVLVHAREPLGVIQVSSRKPASAVLVAPTFAGKVTEGKGEASGHGDLATLRYEPPVEQRGDSWAGCLPKGWGGFSFAVALVWRQSDSKTPMPTVTAKCRRG
jgi:hypothetical protein